MTSDARFAGALSVIVLFPLAGSSWSPISPVSPVAGAEVSNDAAVTTVNAAVLGVTEPIGPGAAILLVMRLVISAALNRSSVPVPASLISPSKTSVHPDEPAAVAWMIWLSAVGPVEGNHDGRLALGRLVRLAAETAGNAPDESS